MIISTEIKECISIAEYLISSTAYRGQLLWFLLKIWDSPHQCTFLCHNEGNVLWDFLNDLIKWCYCCSVITSSPSLCNPMNCSTPGYTLLHYLPEFAQTHVHWVGDAIQQSHPLLLLPSIFPSIKSFSKSQHQVAKVLEFQLQHRSF